ncbi:biotin-dependent carboxyltransferase family protein [Thalassotalea piscium]|uniref:Biotin-dependent carboxylase-like uncharacterized protein n=1 Tax=Thalassotalea piscium TaxID=1230533 RepID=A0A7X0NKF3_9GAMM|nr:biotin-dependent carboxyltransferase family protein [Thalassotalea piscium]MBB6545050.1 biotin-dependent carboxylase-like uncharacterized protein [Thalassotalea piscium]
MQGFIVEKSGVQSILVDSGRFGQAHIGLTQGGPADENAFYWLNRLLGNNSNNTAIECNFGGLLLRSTSDQTIAVTGANAPLFINGQRKATWCSYRVSADDLIELGHASKGAIVYLGVNKGFNIPLQFGSSTTVVRENIGGLSGEPLKIGDILPIFDVETKPLLSMPRKHIPSYHQHLTLRLILGAQHSFFSEQATKTLFNCEYVVSKQADRMGYRLEGPALQASKSSMTSEGIAFGAVQVPPNGQPIVLLSDRQTLGGYPKLGAILSIDAYRLSQCTAGALVYFQEISLNQAQTFLEEEQQIRQLTLFSHQ